MRRLLYLPVLCASLAPVLAGTTSARACTIDGKPSAFANDDRAVIYSKPPTEATYAWWARFAFPRAFHVGQRIAFREDDAQVRKVLPSMADVSRSWRWDFGDKTAQEGDRATHSYARAGRYKVAVDAYFHGYGWEAFDTITITVKR